MIVTMRHITILCMQQTGKTAVEKLRSIGVLHINQSTADTPLLTEMRQKLKNVAQAINILNAKAFSAPVTKLKVSSTTNKLTASQVLDLFNEISECDTAILRIRRELETLAPLGDFEPSLITELNANGVACTLFKAPADIDLSALGDKFVRVISQTKTNWFGVLIGSETLPEKVEQLPLPTRSLTAAKAEQLEVEDRKSALIRQMQMVDRKALQAEKAILTDELLFANATESMSSQGPVSWITGFCPIDKVETVKKAAAEQAWGWHIREPQDGDNVPTLLRPPRLFRPVLALFEALGITPAYNEADISVPFYAFFTLFFAMLVGDAGYGAILLLTTILLRRKFRKAPAAPFILFTVFACAMIVWGIASATYFGIASERLPAFAKHKLSLWLSNQSNIMQLCFILGATHLSIAHIWNAIALFPSSKWLAQIGWVGVIWTMYNAACMVVVQGFRFPTPMYTVAAISVALIALFMLKRDELRTNGIELGMLPLNIISCLGDVISYVRLFAVGLAGVKVAENFNEMSLGLPLALWIKIPVVMVILLLGHGLNMAMGALSILVHAVRLNTLEFSGHKGVSWSGVAYQPLKLRRKTDQETKSTN